jgi:hypothetical protein
MYVCFVSTLLASSSSSSSLPPPHARTHARTRTLTERERVDMCGVAGHVQQRTCPALYLAASRSFVGISIYALLLLRSAAARPSQSKWCSKGLSLG